MEDKKCHLKPENPSKESIDIYQGPLLAIPFRIAASTFRADRVFFQGQMTNEQIKNGK